MANKMKSIRIVSVLVFALVISLALVLYGTLSQLQDSKTATGTVTFNLADYDLVLTTDSVTSINNVAPGIVGQTKPVALYNTYLADQPFGNPTGGGTTAGMGPVYIKMVITSITVGETVENWDASSIVFNNNNGVVMTNANSGLTITLQSSAGTGIYWYYGNNAIYLSSSNTTLAKTTLGFSTASSKVQANINFNISMQEPNVNNGFNAPTANDGIDNNKYQGQTVKINYTLSWATTPN